MDVKQKLTNVDVVNDICYKWKTNTNQWHWPDLGQVYDPSGNIKHVCKPSPISRTMAKSKETKSRYDISFFKYNTKNAPIPIREYLYIFNVFYNTVRISDILFYGKLCLCFSKLQLVKLEYWWQWMIDNAIAIDWEIYICLIYISHWSSLIEIPITSNLNFIEFWPIQLVLKYSQIIVWVVSMLNRLWRYGGSLISKKLETICYWSFRFTD